MTSKLKPQLIEVVAWEEFLNSIQLSPEERFLVEHSIVRFFATTVIC